jgi:hypothetical protein
VPQFSKLINIATDFTEGNQTKRTRATKLVKELSLVALKNPLEHKAQQEEVLWGQGNELDSSDFSPLAMHCY